MSPSQSQFSPTLKLVFATSMIGLAILLIALSWLLISVGNEATRTADEGLEALARRNIGQRVNAVLDEMPRAAESIQLQVNAGVLNPSDLSGLTSSLIAELLRTDSFQELSWTPAAGIQTSEGKKLYALRIRTGKDRSIVMDKYNDEGGAFSVATVAIPSPAATSDQWTKTGAIPSFAQLLSRAKEGDAWRESGADQVPLESGAPGYSVARAITDKSGKIVGVLLINAPISNLNAVLQADASGGQSDKLDDLETFIIDRDGRVVTRGNVSDPTVQVDGVARISTGMLSPQMNAVLEHRSESPLKADAGVKAGVIHSGDRTFLFGLRKIPASPQWTFGVLVPQSAFLSGLDSLHIRVLTIAACIMAGIALGGLLTLRVIRRDLNRVVAGAKRMQQFNFEPAPATERIVIADVREVRESMEQGKLAIRTIQKYVPVGLLRQLYREQKEATLGAEPMELSILFSDIRDFTTVSENLSGPELAHALGLYLDAMAGSINAHSGTIDKYIGDSVMAFWNAPVPIEKDAHRACTAALHSVRACAELFASPKWGSLPRWVTRYGIHRDRVMVGNFGAPDRMNYTAMGDGVNTASRLEGLNKVYGTTIMVSETIRNAVAADFVFRKLDVVAVKGKTKPTHVFELIGDTSATKKSDRLIKYEAAFDAYLTRDFSRGVELLTAQIQEDPPSNVLYTRCVAFQRQPPPPDWNGVFVAHAK